MDADVGESCRRTGRRARSDECRAWKFCDVDVHLRHLGTAQRDRYDMPTGIARFGLHRRMPIIGSSGVVILIGERRIRVLVRGRAVVMIWMIVTDVLVHVQR